MSHIVPSHARELSEARERICQTGLSIHSRGLTFGAAGNLSMRLSDDRLLMTPSGVSLGRLDPASLSLTDIHARHISGDPATKEAFLHSTMYDTRDDAGAVVHLHSTYSVAVSCLKDINHADVLPALTAYYIMRVGKLPLVDYYPPGDKALAKAVEKLAGNHHAVLLANHGPIVAGRDMDSALFATEELEETAKLFLMLQGLRTRPLSADDVADLRGRFPT